MNRVIMITGAASGIGAEIARKFSRLQDTIIIMDIVPLTEQDPIVLECKELGAAHVSVFQANAADYESCESIVKAVIEKYGKIDVLVNNAGITRDGLLIRMTEKQFDDVLTINLKTVFNLSKLVTPYMMKARAGRIINMASVAGVYGNAGQTNYAASKAAIIGFTKSLAKEIGSRGITVNAIAPGFIDTAMTQKLSEEVRKAATDKIALKRYGTIQDVANAAAFLASEDASYITAQVLQVDGGISL